MSPTPDDPSTSFDVAQVSRDRVTLVRDPDLREEGIVLTYRLELADGDPADTTVVDEIPEALPMGDVGFHDEHEPNSWDIDGRTLTFETVVPAQGERVVMFGIPGAAEAAASATFNDPTISAVATIDPDTVRPDELDSTLPDVDVADRAEAITQVINDQSNASASDEPAVVEAASSDDIEAAIGAIDEEDSIQSEPSLNRDGGIDLESEPASTEFEADAGLVTALRASLETASEAEREALAEAIGVEPPESFDARLRHVQTRMDDFVAYADTLEAFIDEHGPAEEFIDEMRSAIDELGTRLEDIEERLEAVEAEVDDRLDTVESRVDDIAETEAERGETMADLEETVAELSADVQNVAAMRETLLDALTATEGADLGDQSTEADEDSDADVVELQDPNADGEG